jgi:signal peptidase I
MGARVTEELASWEPSDDVLDVATVDAPAESTSVIEEDVDASPSAEELMSSGAFPLAPRREFLEPVSVVSPGTRATWGSRFRGRFLRDLGIGGLFVIFTHIFLVQVSVVRGVSMSPSLHDGDRLMVDRISYALMDVSRFDVVVLRYPKNPDVDFVKRIIGLPGDHIEMRSGSLHVNGETVPEEFAHVVDVHAEGSWIVPEGSFFVLGDNRPISGDSREFGTVDRDLLKGKVRVVFWPPSRFAVF